MNQPKPLNQSQRTAIVDILRGWALIGVVLMNYLDFRNPQQSSGTLINALNAFSFTVFSPSKVWALFSVLFGYGFGLIFEKIRLSNQNPDLFFLKRMAVLFLFGVFNTVFFYGDILHDYALLGCLLLLFRKIKARTLFYIIICLLIAASFINAYVNTHWIVSYKKETEIFWNSYMGKNLPAIIKANFIYCYVMEIKAIGYIINVHLQMFTMMLLGLALMKSNFFTKVIYDKVQFKKIVRLSFTTLILVMAFHFAVTGLNGTIVFRYFDDFYLVATVSMMCIVLLICWLSILGKAKGFFGLLQVAGSMTLTNYIVQNILMLILFSGAGFALGYKKNELLYYGLALAVFVAQVWFSKWWLRRYNFGPLEWLWRCLTYGTKYPLKKAVVDKPGI